MGRINGIVQEAQRYLSPSAMVFIPAVAATPGCRFVLAAFESSGNGPRKR